MLSRELKVASIMAHLSKKICAKSLPFLSLSQMAPRLLSTRSLRVRKKSKVHSWTMGSEFKLGSKHFGSSS